MVARVGVFQGPTAEYGARLSTVHPTDNNITPDPTQAAADLLQMNADSLLDEINNALRQNRPPNGP